MNNTDFTEENIRKAIQQTLEWRINGSSDKKHKVETRHEYEKLLKELNNTKDSRVFAGQHNLTIKRKTLSSCSYLAVEGL